MKALKYFFLFIMLTGSVVTETGNLKGKITDAKPVNHWSELM